MTSLKPAPGGLGYLRTISAVTGCEASLSLFLTKVARSPSRQNSMTRCIWWVLSSKSTRPTMCGWEESRMILISEKRLARSLPLSWACCTVLIAMSLPPSCLVSVFQSWSSLDMALVTYGVYASVNYGKAPFTNLILPLVSTDRNSNRWLARPCRRGLRSSSRHSCGMAQPM